MLEWKKIWELTIWDKKFNGVDKLMQPKVIKYHYYLANELTNLERNDGDIRILYTTDKIAYTSSEDVEGNICEGEVVAIPWGGNPTVKYYSGRFVTADNRIATSNDTSVLNNKYLYYFMLSRIDIIGSFYRGAGIKHPSMLSVLNMDIPIPSLSEQTRIVGILDTFTASIENLKQQIAYRRKQYEHYRDQLLDLEGKEGVEMKTLGEIGKCKAGATPSTKKTEYWVGGNIPWMSSGEVHQKVVTHTASYITKKGYENASTKMLPVNTVVIALAGQGKTRGSVAITAIELCTNQSLCGVIINNGKIVNKYVYHYLLTRYNDLRRISSGDGTRGGLNLKMISSYPIPIPSTLEQQRIVSILDTFESSIANLERQLVQRERQYEYYRNQLLTF